MYLLQFIKITKMDYSDINPMLRQHLWDEYQNKRPFTNRLVFKQREIEIQLSESAIDSINKYDDDDNKQLYSNLVDDNDYSSDYILDHAIYEIDLVDMVKDIFELYLQSDYNRFNGIRIVSKQSDSICLEIYLRY